MAEPTVGADAAGIAAAAATVAGAVATGGLSLLAQGIISQFAADRSTCRTALEIDTGGGSRKVALIRAGSRDDENFDSPVRSRAKRRNQATSTPENAAGKTLDDGN
jgi:hypothetical protein